VTAARAAELARYPAYGEQAEVKEALQAATMWNYIYTPAEYGPFLPVSRAWNFVKGNVNLDWAYVIFDWDNIFASYMTSLDPRAKDIAYSNYIQVVRSRTARGMVPNYSAGGTKSLDRTEPPIGAKVLLELAASQVRGRLTGRPPLRQPAAVGRLVLTLPPTPTQTATLTLTRWSDWFAAERMHGPLGPV
jgi:hypothetical protein